MLVTTIGKILNKGVDTTGCRLYLIKNGEKDVLYVGQTTNFTKRLRAHITKRHEPLEGPLGKTIYSHMPDAEEWEVELYTVEECSDLIRKWFPSEDLYKDGVRYAEDSLIHQFNPAFNRTVNVGFGIRSAFTERRWAERKQKELEYKLKAAEKREFLIKSVCDICGEHDTWTDSEGNLCGVLEEIHGFNLLCNNCSQVIYLMERLKSESDRVCKIEEAYSKRGKVV